MLGELLTYSSLCKRKAKSLSTLDSKTGPGLKLTYRKFALFCRLFIIVHNFAYTAEQNQFHLSLYALEWR